MSEVKQISEFGKKQLQDAAQVSVGEFCDDLMNHQILPAYMMAALGEVKADGSVYKFKVIAEMVDE